MVEQIRLRICGYEFFRLLDAARDAVLEELDKSDSVVALAEEEVQSISELFDLHGGRLRVLF